MLAPDTKFQNYRGAALEGCPRFQNYRSAALQGCPRSRGSLKACATVRLPRVDESLKAKSVLGELEVHPVVVRADGGDLRDDHAQIVAVEGIDHRLAEVDDGIDGADAREPGAS